MKKKHTRLSTQAVMVILGNTLANISGLLTGIFLVRFLNKTEYGTYLQARMITDIAGPLSDPGLSRAFYFFIPQLEGRYHRKYLGQTYFIILSVVLSVAVILILLRSYISEWLNNDRIIFLMPVIAALLIGQRLGDSFWPIFISTGRTKLAGFFAPVNALLILIFVCFPVYLGLGASGALSGLAVAFILPAVFIILFIISLRYSPETIPKEFSIVSQLKYGLPLAFTEVVALLGIWLDKLMMAFFSKPADFAVYARGAFDLPLIGLIPYSLTNVLLPKFVQFHKDRQHSELIKLWHESIRRTALIMMPAFVFFFVIGELFITFMFTEGYRDSALIFRIYLLVVPARLTAYGAILAAAGKTKDVFWGGVVLSVSGIISNLIFYNIMGPVGLAIAKVFSSYSNIIFLLSRIKKTFDISLVKLLPWRMILKIFAFSVCCGALISPLTLLNLSKLYVLIICGCLFPVIYLGFGIAINIIRSEDRILIMQWVTFGKFKKDSLIH